MTCRRSTRALRPPPLKPAAGSRTARSVPGWNRRDWRYCLSIHRDDRPHYVPRSDLRDLIGPMLRRKGSFFEHHGHVQSFQPAREAISPQTQVFVSASTVSALLQGVVGGTDRDTQDQAQLIRSRAVAAGVIRKLRLRETPTAVLSSVTALPSTGANFVSVSVERGSAAKPADGANAFVAEYIAYRGLQLARDVEPAIRDARRQLAKLPTGPSASTGRQDLRGTIPQPPLASCGCQKSGFSPKRSRATSSRWRGKIPDYEGKHTLERLNQRVTVLLIETNQDFGVGLRGKAVTPTQQPPHVAHDSCVSRRSGLSRPFRPRCLAVDDRPQHR